MRYTIPPNCETHILVGDAKGGGHRHGAGKGKSEFPSSWSDNHILDMIKAVANDPASIATSGRMGRLKIKGQRQGVVITVIVDPASWTVITGYPV